VNCRVRAGKKIGAWSNPRQLMTRRGLYRPVTGSKSRSLRELLPRLADRGTGRLEPSAGTRRGHLMWNCESDQPPPITKKALVWRGLGYPGRTWRVQVGFGARLVRTTDDLSQPNVYDFHIGCLP